jgi:glycosyltransferase involved in cell wall biosynthesis
LDTPILTPSVSADKNGQATPKSKAFRLLFLSRIHQKKGVELLFDALAQVPFDWSLNIAGDGEKEYIEQLKQRSKTLNIDHKINWLGWVNPDERASIFGVADLLVLPSYNENFANVVIESLAAGTPVLVSKYVGLSEYVAANDLGWVCDTTVESLKNTLIEANNQLERRQHISEHSSQKIQQDFDPSVLVQRYVKMYKNLK